MLAAVAEAQEFEPRSQDVYRVVDEPRLLNEARRFRQAAGPLGDVLAALRKLDFDDSSSALRDILARQAVDLLQMVDLLAEESGPYQTVDQFSDWDGTSPPALAGFQVLDDFELSEHLDATRARLDHLGTEIAEPAVAFLLRDDLASGGRNPPAVAKWQRIMSELQRRKADNPQSTVTSLERFIRFELSPVNLETCFQKLGEGVRAPTSGDYFLQHREQLRRQVLDRCRELAAEAVHTDYARLAADFNETLAGRYPFAEFRDGRDTPEASVPAAAEFLKQFDAAEPVLRRGLGTAIPGSPAGRAMEFIDRIAAVRNFLAPFMQPASDEAGPGFDVEADFRVNRAAEAGGNQIIEWMLELGRQQVRRGRGPDGARWRPGDPVTVTLRWAKDAPLVPVAVSGPDAPRVQDRSAIFGYANRWSLIRALQVHQGASADFERKTDPQPHTLKFVTGTGSAEAAVPGASASPGRTTVFIRLALTSPTADGKDKRRHVLPRFPYSAPLLPLNAIR
jgi:hypothetical protein